MKIGFHGFARHSGEGRNPGRQYGLVRHSGESRNPGRQSRDMLNLLDPGLRRGDERSGAGGTPLKCGHYDLARHSREGGNPGRQSRAC